MSAPIHRVLASAHVLLADTLERYPDLSADLVRSVVQQRASGGAVLIRAELHVTRAPQIDTLGEPQRCPWLPEFMEVALCTGAIAIWPDQSQDLEQILIAESDARRALRNAQREQEREGDISDQRIDRLVKAARALRPGPLRALVVQAALEANATGRLSEETRAAIAPPKPRSARAA